MQAADDLASGIAAETPGAGASWPPFRPRFPWRSGDLQTLRNTLVPTAPCLDGWPGERLWLPMDDGSGDALAAMLHRSTAGTALPLAILIHGLTGCEDSTYMRSTARTLLARGHPVLRLNLRGAGPSGESCAYRYHAGRTEDLRAVLGALDPALKSNGMIAVGYSLGANMLLKYLGEEGTTSPLEAAISVSAPIDLAATAYRFHAPRNRIYLAYMMRRIKAETLRPAAALDAAMRRAVARSRTVVEFDDVCVAPMNGFAGAGDYYARTMALRYLPAVRIPTLVIQAQDDPWIPPEPYLGFDWSGNPFLTPLLPPSGGHVGFHGSGHATPWHDRVAVDFLDRVLGRPAGAEHPVRA